MDVNPAMRRILLVLLLGGIAAGSAGALVSGVDALSQAAIVAKLNALRASHSTPALAWSSPLASAAQSWADYLAAKDVLMHSSLPYGENIACLTPAPKASAADVVDAAIALWYAEGDSGYPYGGTVVDPPMAFLHFTQLIWVDTLRAGAGVGVSAASGRAYVVMSFDPPGNYMGQYGTNVRPPLVVVVTAFAPPRPISPRFLLPPRPLPAPPRPLPSMSAPRPPMPRALLPPPPRASLLPPRKPAVIEVEGPHYPFSQSPMAMSMTAGSPMRNQSMTVSPWLSPPQPTTMQTLPASPAAASPPRGVAIALATALLNVVAVVLAVAA